MKNDCRDYRWKSGMKVWIGNVWNLGRLYEDVVDRVKHNEKYTYVWTVGGSMFYGHNGANMAGGQPYDMMYLTREDAVKSGCSDVKSDRSERDFWQAASQSSLDKIWDNPDDDVYSELLK